MKLEKVTILNNKKLRLVGHLYRNTSKTLLIMLHGTESIITFPGAQKVFEAYYATGSSVFVFDFLGYGESEGKKSLSIKQRVEDTGDFIKHFSEEYQEIILYSVSMAGIVGAIAAVKYKQVTKLITINGLFYLHPTKLYWNQIILVYSYLISHPKLWEEYFYWKRNFIPAAILIPTLVVYGECDDIIKPIQSRDFYKSLSSIKQILPVPKGDHSLMKEEYEKITIAVPEWIKKQII